jgi:hypothetical protein
MARFYLTSSKRAHEKAAQLNTDAGLETDGENNKDNIYFSTYKKRAIDSNTYRELESPDFVAVSGTLVMDGKLGEEALPLVYEEFRNSGARGVRANAFGHYTVILRHEDEIVVFCDPNSVYELYYTEKDSWFISNSLYLCGATLDTRTINRHALYQRAIEYCEISDKTLFDDVRRVPGGEIIRIDTTTQQLTTEALSLPEKTWEYKERGLEHVLTEYTQRTENVFSQIASAADGIGIQATGGLDSRTVLAGLLQQDVDPLITYAVGNSGLTNTRAQDLEAVKQYANRYDLNFHQMDWTCEYPIENDTWDELFRKYGFRYHTYGATPTFFAEFENGFPGDPEMMLSGYGFGTFSNVYFWEDDSIVPISFQDMVADIFSLSSKYESTVFQCKEQYLQRLTEECARALELMGEHEATEKPLDLDRLTRVVQLLNGRPQSAYVNIANEFTYHLSPFATYELGRPMIDFPREYRQGEKMRIKQLKKHYPDLASIPLYTGGQMKRITDADKLKFDGRIDKRFLKRLSSILPEPVVDTLHPLYNKLYSSSEGVDSKIRQSHIDRISSDGPISDCFVLDEYDDDIRWTARLVHYDYAISKMGYENITAE